MLIAVITVEPAFKYSFVFKKYANELDSISAALSSPVFVLAHFPEKRLVIEPTNEANARLTLSPRLHVKPLTSVITAIKT